MSKKLEKAMKVLPLILEEVKEKGAVLASWLEADGMCVTLTIEEKMFGLDYACPYIDLSSFKNGQHDEFLKEYCNNILYTYSNITNDSDSDNEETLSIKEFVENYRYEAERCNTKFKTEFLQRAEELEALVAGLNSKNKPKI